MSETDKDVCVAFAERLAAARGDSWGEVVALGHSHNAIGYARSYGLLTIARAGPFCTEDQAARTIALIKAYLGD